MASVTSEGGYDKVVELVSGPKGWPWDETKLLVASLYNTFVVCFTKIRWGRILLVLSNRHVWMEGKGRGVDVKIIIQILSFVPW